MLLSSSLPSRVRVVSSTCRLRLQDASAGLSRGALEVVFGRQGPLAVAARASSSSSKHQQRSALNAVSAPDAEAKASEAKEASAAYPFKEVEKKWQAYWDTNKTFRTPEKASVAVIRRRRQLSGSVGALPVPSPSASN